MKSFKYFLILATIITCNWVEAGWFTAKEKVELPKKPEISYIVTSRDGIELCEIYSDGQVILKQGNHAFSVVRLTEILINQKTVYEAKIFQLQQSLKLTQKRSSELEKAYIKELEDQQRALAHLVKSVKIITGTEE